MYTLSGLPCALNLASFSLFLAKVAWAFCHVWNAFSRSRNASCKQCKLEINSNHSHIIMQILVKIHWPIYRFKAVVISRGAIQV